MFNPEFFVLQCDYNRYNVGDTVGVESIRFETAIDTTGKQAWNADSTNLFVADGNYNHPFYGMWMFEEVIGETAAVVDTLSYRYPLRILAGAWVRLVFTAPSDVDDTLIVNWSLISER